MTAANLGNQLRSRDVYVVESDQYKIREEGIGILDRCSKCKRCLRQQWREENNEIVAEAPTFIISVSQCFVGRFDDAL